MATWFVVSETRGKTKNRKHTRCPILVASYDRCRHPIKPILSDAILLVGQNAVEGAGKERFDHYGGHTDQHGIYHYHQIPGSWLYTGEADELLGVAFDGFPIYGPMASDLGREVTNNDLDQCHGRMVNGHYRYHANTEFPYYLGCYKGATVDKARTQYGTCTSTSGKLTPSDLTPL